MARRHVSRDDSAAEEFLECLVGSDADDLQAVETHLRVFRGIEGFELAEHLADFLEAARETGPQ